jgi:hypothetical protein
MVCDTRCPKTQNSTEISSEYYSNRELTPQLQVRYRSTYTDISETVHAGLSDLTLVDTETNPCHRLRGPLLESMFYAHVMWPLVG